MHPCPFCFYCRVGGLPGAYQQLRTHLSFRAWTERWNRGCHSDNSVLKINGVQLEMSKCPPPGHLMEPRPLDFAQKKSKKKTWLQTMIHAHHSGSGCIVWVLSFTFKRPSLKLFKQNQRHSDDKSCVITKKKPLFTLIPAASVPDGTSHGRAMTVLFYWISSVQ